MKIRMTLTLACCLLANVATAQTATDVTCTSCVGETDIANQAVTGAKIANGTITATDIRLSTITSDRIKNQTLVMADLAPSLQDDIGGAIANFTVQRVSASATSVVGAACPSDRIPVGASCECDDANGARNIGVLFGCTVTGTGAAAGCFDEAATFNPTLPEPLAIVRAVCLGAESVDGTPWVPTSTGLVVDRNVSESAAAEQARWMKEQHDSFESVLARFRDQRAAFESRRGAIAK
jgi:hypothetical protein